MSQEREQVRAAILEKLLGWQWRGIPTGPATGKSFIFSPDKVRLTCPESPGDVRQLHFSVRDDDPTTDLNVCRLAEQKIMELGLGAKYAEKFCQTHHLALMTDEDCAHEFKPDYSDAFDLLTASPEARCLAMLAVLEDR